MTKQANVIIVGAGNAAYAAAMAASDADASVVMLERAPEEESGGIARFTAGAMCVAYDGVEHLREIMSDLSYEEIARTDFGSYSEVSSLATWAGSRITEQTRTYVDSWSRRGIVYLG